MATSSGCGSCLTQAGEGLELPPSWLSPGKNRSQSCQTSRGVTVCPPADPQCPPPHFLAAQARAEEVPCARSRLCGAPRCHPKPAQKPFSSPGPLSPPKMKLLPQDTTPCGAAEQPTAAGGCRCCVPVPAQTHGPFFAPRPRTARSALADRSAPHNVPPCSPRPSAGLRGMAGNRLRFLLEFYYIHRINKQI